MKRVLVLGGYGTFGSHVCRHLVTAGMPLTVAGRDPDRAKQFAQSVGGGVRALAVDLRNAEACGLALREHAIAVNCAGPFQDLDAGLLEACLQTGCAYADMADDRKYTALVRSFHERFRAAGLPAVHGCSSLPGISGALALVLRQSVPAAIKRVRVTLFIGNRNPKGEAAVRSLLAGLGRPIAAPQGTLRGFCDREVVALPEPFGPRGVFNFDSPEYDLFPSLLDTHSVSVKVGFELRLATYTFALLARLKSGYGPFTARLFDGPSRQLGRFGSSGGAVSTEFFCADGTCHQATLLARADGQRMAALPCAIVVRSIWEKQPATGGVMTAYDLLGAKSLLEQLTAEGFELHTTAGGSAGCGDFASSPRPE
jgi:hypothetical protein